METSRKPPAVQPRPQPQCGPELTGQQEAFLKHLEQVSGIVQTWPGWKQRVLGGALARSASSEKR